MLTKLNKYKCRFNRALPGMVALIAGVLLCALPEDAAQNPENVTLTVVRNQEREDTVTIGDSLRLLVAVQYPYLVDSVKIKVGEFYTAMIRSIADTLSVSLLPDNPGKFAVELTGYCLRDVVAHGAATVFVKSIPIVVTIEPVDDTVVEGASALFTTAAAGNPMPAIQWYRDSVAISGATGDTLLIDTARLSLGGFGYRARFANGVDTLWSRRAVLAVSAAVYRWNSMRWGGAVWW